MTVCWQFYDYFYFTFLAQHISLLMDLDREPGKQPRLVSG